MEILIEGILDYCEVKEWKKRYFVMKYEVTSGIRYIEFYKDKNWRKQLPKHVVNLHPGYEVKRVKNDPKKKYRFTIKTTDHSLALASDDENIMNQWLATLEEYNLVKSFCVQPQDNPTMMRINAIYPCHLQLVQSEVRLVSAMDGKLLGMWPFKCIRRYKFTGNVFCIEAGRKAPTGEGLFEFISNECSEIYRVMDTIIRSKAGDSTMRRLASEKIQKSVEKHGAVRKTHSVPPTPLKIGELHYDYAAPSCTISELSKANPRQVNVPKLPKQDTSYNVLYPKDCSFESQFTNPPATMSKEEGSSYDTLNFNVSTGQENNNLQVGDELMNANVSGGAYDAVFNQHSPKRKSTDGKAFLLKTGRSESYDKLQFSRSPNSSSFEGDRCRNNRTNDSESQNATASGSVYNTLSHLQIFQPSVPPKDDTYDCLTDMTNTCQLDANTYDSLFDTKPSVERASDHTDNKPEHPVPEKPLAPARPPPRRQHGNSQEEVAHSKKPVAPTKPGRLAKLRKVPPDNNGKVAAKLSTQQDDLREIIQQKLTKHDDIDIYDMVDHEYASIDYTKVSRSDSELSADAIYSDAVYSEPGDPESTPTPIIPPKPVKPKRNPPKLMKNIFKKNPAPLKAKTPTEDVNFANELKKKLEDKLKKSDDSTTRRGSAPSNRSDSNLPATTEGQHHDEGLYDEVNSDATYSKPFHANDEMDV